MKMPPTLMSERSNARLNSRPDASRQRVFIVVLILSLWMIIICGRLVYLQTVQYEWLSERARQQQQRTLVTGMPRGLILDRQGHELARSVDVASFFVVPTDLEDPHRAAAQLAPVLKLDAAKLAAQLQEAKDANHKYMWLARKVSDEQAAQIEALKIKGVQETKESKRYYPNGELAAHVLGFVGLDDAGLGGIELFQNAALNGDGGKVLMYGDGKSRSYESYAVEAHPGQSVVLTIDQNVQYQTEKALADAVARNHAKSGTALVVDPHTGEVLALANSPTFDPNEAHKVDPQVRLNGALQNIYEPGSTFKIVAYSGAIEERLARPDDRIDCQMGAITVAGRLVKDSHAYGVLTLTEALAKSSNVAAIKLGLRLGDERMHEYMMRFGFGSKTGIELKGETPGIVRPIARWQPSSMGSIAIGQEVGVTPIQMAAAFSTIANDGVRIAPHIVREIREADGTIAQRPAPDMRRVVSIETARTLRPMLESVTLNGTAKRAQLDGYTAAGKTGTAQKIDPRTHAYSKTKYVASFVGFAPVENPAVVIIVVIDEPAGAYHGGEVAAPVFSEIAENVLPYLDVAPDTELKSQATARDEIAQSERWGNNARAIEQPAPETSAQKLLPQVVVTPDRKSNEVGEIVYAASADRALLMPDMRGWSVRDAVRVCSQLGLELEARGEGRALRQNPAPGAKVEVGQIVRVEFARSD